VSIEVLERYADPPTHIIAFERDVITIGTVLEARGYEVVASFFHTHVLPGWHSPWPQMTRLVVLRIRGWKNCRVA
jgi:hypothetical protein